MAQDNNLSDREFYEGIINVIREQTYLYILDKLEECETCEIAKEKLKKELVKIHKANIETTNKHINGKDAK